jgi:hypothetical protein
MESWIMDKPYNLIYYISVLAVDDRHIAFCEYNDSVARIICVAVATLANKKLLERADNVISTEKTTENNQFDPL